MLLQPSIQKKVSYGYYLCLALIVIVSAANYLNLRRIEAKIDFSIIISKFFDATLEMRRFEKNYIIYKNTDDYNENLKFTNAAEDILRKNEGEIKRFSPATDISKLKAEIAGYKLLMNEYSTNPAKAYILEGKIRASGRAIVTTAETISDRVRVRLQSLIASSGRLLIASIVFLIIAGCLIGQYLSQVVVRPLKQIETCMQDVSRGNFISLPITSSDREIIFLRDAFNKMMKELERRQLKVIAQSEKLASLGTMTSGIAHQLNNPISNIYTSCQILSEEIEEPNMDYKKELLRQIEEQVERTKDMIHSLLEFSKKKEFRNEPLPLLDLIDSTLRLIKGIIPTKIEISVDVPEDLWITVDKQRMQQAFLNIIKNGIDAIPDEGKVTISATEDPETKAIEIRIHDTGIGIESEDKDRIFEPFFTTKGDKEGSGLGLFVAREIVHEHGGIIDVSSTLGKGTTFRIKLPPKEW